MPPRRRAPPACAASAEALALVFALLPVDVRLRCREVCTSWRHVLSDRALWTRLDLSSRARAGGLTRPITEGLFAAALARAAGALTWVDVTGCGSRLSPGVLMHGLLDSRATLREVHMTSTLALPAEGADLLMSSMPRLRVLEMDLGTPDVCGGSELALRRLLRAATGACPGAPAGCELRVRTLDTWLRQREGSEAERVAALHALAEDVGAHEPLRTLKLCGLVGEAAPESALSAACCAVLHAAAARRLRALHCGLLFLTPDLTAALARLLSSGLEELTLLHCLSLPRAAVHDVLAPALRDSPSLTALSVTGSQHWSDAASVLALLRGAAANPRLRSLSLQFASRDQVGPAAYRAHLGALLAELPALHGGGGGGGGGLTALDVSGCGLRDEGLAPLLAALARSGGGCTLRTLRLGGNELSDAAARAHLLPAARACGALRELHVGDDAPRAARAAAALVRARI
jgi:hypothetical protein